MVEDSASFDSFFCHIRYPAGRQGKDSVPITYRHIQCKAGKVVSVEVIGTIMRRTIKQFGTYANFFPNFETMVLSMHRKKGCDFWSVGTRRRDSLVVTFIKTEQFTFA